MPGRAPIYSVDASALIQLKEDYPFTVVGFRSMWEFIGGLGDQSRVQVVQAAHEECKDQVLKDWFKEHPGIVRPFSTELNAYINALNRELKAVHLPLVDPDSTTNLADPDVIALALMIEGRPLEDLSGDRNGESVVICYEAARREKGLAKIPLVCRHYGLDCVKWPAMLEREGWTG